MKYEDFLVCTLGKGGVDTPFKQPRKATSPACQFICDPDLIFYDVSPEDFSRCIG